MMKYVCTKKCNACKPACWREVDDAVCPQWQLVTINIGDVIKIKNHGVAIVTGIGDDVYFYESRGTIGKTDLEHISAVYREDYV